MKRFARSTILVLFAGGMACSSVSPSSGGFETETSPPNAALLGDGVSALMRDNHVPSDVLVYLKGKPDLDAMSLTGSREDRANEVVRRLADRASKSQEALLTWLGEHGASTRSFFTVNAILVKGATPSLIRQIAARSDVAKVTLDAMVASDSVVDGASVSPSALNAQWGVAMIRAPEAWSRSQGEGVVVGVIGAGVLGTHVALSAGFAGGWHDAVGGRLKPFDYRGTGTHITGIAVGRTNGIGVAPAARWVACAACDSDGNCAESALITCGQFMMTVNPRPHVVLAGFGGAQNALFYDSTITALRNAGIIPVFSIGNNGSRCRTANSPGDRPNLISVGATTSIDAMAGFSSRGPTGDGSLAPVLAAPGQNVASASINSNTSYESRSGSAMAAAHVAGAVALVLGANPTWNFEQVLHALTTTAAHPTLSPSDRNCGLPDPENEFPNQAFGHGRIDVGRALETEE